MTIIENLKAWGANTEMGIKRCANSEALYLRLVNMVPKNDGFEKLEAAIVANNLEDAFQAAHGLKGILSNLELSPLLNPIYEITELLRNKTNMDYSNLIKKIKDEKVEFDKIVLGNN